MSKHEYEYTIDPQDHSIGKIREKEEFYGLEISEPMIFPKKMGELSKEIFADKKIMDTFEYQLDTPDESAIKASSKLWEELGFEIHDVSYYGVPYKFKGKADEEFFKAVANGSPFDIPIKFVDDFNKTNVSADRIRFTKSNAIVFKHVKLPKVGDQINSTIYAHEIAHTQLDTAGSGVESIKSYETMPMFIEQIFADKLDSNGALLEQSRNHRLAYMAAAINMLKNNEEMDFEKRITLEMDIISTIQGIDLFNKYKAASKKERKEMIDSINRIFSGDYLVEEMLGKYNSHFDKVEPNLKTLVKKRK